VPANVTGKPLLARLPINLNRSAVRIARLPHPRGASRSATLIDG